MRCKAFIFVTLVSVAACQPPMRQPGDTVHAHTVTLPPLLKAPVLPPHKPVVRDNSMAFQATAYSLEGITKCGTRARRGIVAVDPRVIPLRSKIRVTNAGKYSGIYLAEDTGRLIKGNIIDVKVMSYREARLFGRQQVKVEVLRWGPEVVVEASAK
jgi:3D (Asp-Asp-Asp) domain-containing protein